MLGEVVSKTRSLVNDNYIGVTEIIMIIIHATYDGVVFFHYCRTSWTTCFERRLCDDIDETA